MRKVKRPKGAPRPGGKALARLRLFEHQRLLERSNGGWLKQFPRRQVPVQGEASSLEEANEARTALSARASASIQQGWRPLGPYAIPHGQTYGEGPGSRPPVAGRIATVALDPSDATHILIGAGGGGVWESRDRGKTWRPRTDEQPSLAIGAIAFTPSDPKVVYAGTGEGDALWQLGAGLLRSTDGGATWSVHATAPFLRQGFFDLVVDPLDARHLLAATTAGLYESTDSGATWVRRRGAWTYDLSMHPPRAGDASSTREVLAGCTDGLFRSIDGGRSWSAVSMPGGAMNFQRIEVCHAPSNGNIAYVAAAWAGDESAGGLLWRRTVRGGAFAAISPPPDLEAHQGWYDWHAAVAPHNPNILYLGAIDLHKGTRSATGKWSWEKISARASGDSIHPDQHAMAFSPNSGNVIYAANDGGLYRSPNAGRTWESLNKGLSITEYEFLADHPAHDAWLIAGTQDNGTLRYEGTEVWFHVADGDGGDCGVNHESPYTCYHSFYGLGMEKSRRGGNAGSWSYKDPGSAESLFYPPLEVNGSLVVQAGSSVFASLDDAQSFEAIALPQAAGNASALAVPSKTRIYAGTENGRIYRIDRASGKWKAPAALARPRSGFVSDLLVDPTNPSRLWATFSTLAGGHVYRSDDGGQSFSDVSAGLPAIPLNAIEVDPAHPDTVWVAADVGVWRSTDAGQSWQPYSRMLPNALVKDLLFHEQTRLLRAATQSRGVWEIAVDKQTMPDVELYLRDSTVDTARRSPSPTGVDDPFHFTPGTKTHWWECTDIKVDPPPYQRPNASDVDFEVFEDDHGMAAAGLVGESPQRGQTARVFVQVHNRGPKAAADVAVRVFWCPASLQLPDLPQGFWSGFPTNSLPTGSPWKPVAAHLVLPLVEAGRGAVASFDWALPSGAPAQVSLLAIISAADDPLVATERRIATLVPGERRCGLRSMAVVNPRPDSSPPVRAVALRLFGRDEPESYSVELDQSPSRMVRAIVLPGRLAETAGESGLEPVELDEEERASLAELIAGEEELEDRLEAVSAFRPPRKAALLESLDLDPLEPEILVAILAADADPGSAAIVQRTQDGETAGGFTLRARRDASSRG